MEPFDIRVFPLGIVSCLDNKDIDFWSMTLSLSDVTKRLP
jgi:hypothetical protein